MFTRLRAWIRYRHFERELAEEIETHRAMKVRELEAKGILPGEARDRARRELGNVVRMREEARGVWLAPWLESLVQDVRYGVRSLRRQPAFTVAVLATLVLGIGLSTSLFTVFNAVMLQRWNVADPGRVVILGPASSERVSDAISVAEYRYLQAHVGAFSGLVAMTMGGARISPSAVASPEYVQSAWVSSNFFDVLGVPMRVGRAFAPEEGVFGTPRAVVVISHALWQRQFGGDSAVVGRTIFINTQPFSVVGVAARGFTGTQPVVPYDVWMPLASMPLTRSLCSTEDFGVPARNPWCQVGVAGRLAPGVTRATAAAEVDVLSSRFRANWALRPRRLELAGTAPIGRGPRALSALVLMLGAVSLVLLLACANVGNLQLARALARRHEIGVRLALGAGRLRVVRQLVTENLLLALAAGGLGIGLAFVVPRAVLQAAGVAFADAVVPDGTVLAVALGLALLSALATGLTPALYGTRPGTNLVAGRHLESTPSGVGPRGTLLAAQVALSVVLLVGAGHLTRGISAAMSMDLGFAVDDVLVVSVTWPSDALKGAPSRDGRSVMEVVDAAGLGPVSTVEVPPLEPYPLMTHARRFGEAESEARRVTLRRVTRRYFDVLGLPLVAGRPLDDRPGSHEAVVNETLERLLWPGQSAVEHVVVADGVSYRVVGVVRDSRVAGFEAVEPMLHSAYRDDARTLLVRRGPPDTVARLQAVFRTLDPRIQVSIAPLADNLRRALRNSIYGARLAWAAGLVGLGLAIVGVFGVFAYIVEERRREIGIRLALGASRRLIIGFIFRQTRISTAGGLAAGFLLSLGVGPLLRHYLFGANPFDPITFGGIALVVLVAAVTATYVPVRRATRVDPAVTLRCD